jgi:hypothetical protein
MSPTAMSWGPGAWVRHAAPPLRGGASPVNYQGSVFLRERHHITPVWPFIELCSLGMRPRGHEASHHATILELVPDEVCMIWAGLFEKTLEVICMWPCLTLVTACDR